MTRWSLLPLRVVCLLWALSPGAEAATKVDLSAYFADRFLVNDVKVFRSDLGGTRTSNVVQIDRTRSKVRLVERTDEDGIVSLEESFLLPGRKLLIGDLSVAGIEFDLKPKTVLPLRLVPGKPFRYSAAGRIYYSGEYSGRVKLKGSTISAGFEDISTPYWKIPGALRLERTQTLTMKIANGGPVIVIVGHTTSWIDPAVGNVGSVESTSTYEDGVLTDETGPTSWWFDSGVIGGVPVP